MAAIITLVLHHVARPADAMAEMARVLHPSGHVILIDLCAHGQEWLRFEQADLWLGFSEDEVQLASFFGIVNVAGRLAGGY